MSIKILGFIFIILLSTNVNAQNFKATGYRVGDHFGDYTFNDVINYQKRNFSTKDVEGKWLVIDFWTRFCSVCIESFPKMDALNRNFQEKVQIIMVGAYDKGISPNDSILTKKMFEIQRKKYNLSFPAAFDGMAYQNFDLGVTPYILVINPQGIIVAKTISLDSIQLRTFINGSYPKYLPAFSKNEPNKSVEYRHDFPLLTLGQKSNGGTDTDFLFRSLLTKWNDKLPVNFSDDHSQAHSGSLPGKIEAIGMDLNDLLRIAYTGKNNWYAASDIYDNFYKKIFLNLRDTSQFQRGNEMTGENLYCYSLIMPSKRWELKNSLQIMQKDLQRFFCFYSNVEKRNVNVYKLIVIDSSKVNKLKTNGGDPHFYSLEESEGFACQNWSITRLIKFSGLSRVLEKMYRYDPPPLIDDTNIKYNISVRVEANFDSLGSVRAALNKVGFDIVKGKKEMNCIVVRDSKFNILSN